MKNLNIYILAMLITLIGIHKVQAGIEPVVSTVWKAADLQVGSVLSLQDGKYTHMSGLLSGATDGRTFSASSGVPGFHNKKVTNRIVFKIDQYAKLFQPTAYTVKVELEIKTKVFNAGSSSYVDKTHTKYLTVNYDPQNIYNDQVVYEFNDEDAPNQLAGYAMDVKIISVSGLPTACNVVLYTEIETERYYNFVVSNTVTMASGSPQVVNNAVRVSWDNAVWAERYDLEWYHVSTLGMSTVLSAVPYSADAFRYNATRVTVTDNFFDIPLIYTQGYIVFRVRGYGRTSAGNYGTLIPGEWSSVPACTGPCLTLTNLAASHYKKIDPAIAHEEKLNWQYSIAFAEQGKNQVSVNYFDGTLRNRQTVAKSKILDRVIVSQKIYDYEGRPAIEILPAPSAESNISYKDAFNTNPANKAYNRDDFDKDTTECSSSTKSMNTATGSSRYYSPSNNLSATLSGSNAYLKQLEKFIPDAEGYPFAQTVYTPDNTGRVRVKTGVGKTFKLQAGNTGKVTKYFYGKPFQEELDRLFGYEVGDAAFYNKNMTVDANNQVSISYQNPAGKTIATTLAGSDPINLLSIRDTPLSVTPPARIDLFNKSAFRADERGSENKPDLNTRSLTLNRTLLIDKEQPYYFAYENKGKRDTIICSTTGTKFCFDCVFDLTVSLTDDCGNEYLAGVDSTTATTTEAVIGKSILTNITGSSPTYNSISQYSAPFTAKLTNNFIHTATDDTVGYNWFTKSGGVKYSLPVGSYYLKKKLTLNEKVLNYYTNDYIVRNNCLLTITDFKSKFAYLEDIYDCEMTCEQCTTRLGNYADYHGTTKKEGYPELSEDEFDKLLEQCLDRCRIKSNKCASAYETMLMDVSPNGQYGEVREKSLMDGGIIANPLVVDEVKPYLFPLSVYNDDNLLPLKSSFNGRRASWRFPYTESGEAHYYDDKGNVDYVTVIYDAQNGTYNPTIGRQEFLIYNADDDTYKIEPQYLANAKDFVLRFTPSWARSLIMYHPEYKLYVLCGNMQPSHDFDEQWLTINSVESARSAFGAYDYYGYLNPLGSNWPGLGNTNNAPDPFFDPSKNPWLTEAEYLQMQNLMSHFAHDDASNVDITIWDVAFQATIFPNSEVNCNNSNTSFSFDFNNNVDINSTGISIDNADKVWVTFRSLYLSLKQRVQEKMINRISIEDGDYACYNGCIGSTNFNATKNGFEKYPYCMSAPGGGPGWATGQPWNFVYSWSQYFNFEQPCNASRAYLYKEKTPRFPGAISTMKVSAYDDSSAYFPDEDEVYHLESQKKSNAIIDEVKKNAEYGAYNQCGKCPVANQLEQLISQIVSKPNGLFDYKQLTCNGNSDDNVNIIDKSLYTMFTGSTDPGVLTWEPEGATSKYEVVINIGSNGCKMKLSFPDNGGFVADDFRNVIGFYNLKYKFNSAVYPSGSNNTFEGWVYINPRMPSEPGFKASQTKQVLIEGYISCLDIANCTFEPTCEPSKIAGDMLNLFNVLTMEPDQSLCIPPMAPQVTSKFLTGYSDSVALTGTLNPYRPYAGSMTPSLSYALDLAITPSIVNVNEPWQWKSYLSQGNPNVMIAMLYSAGGDSTLNGGNCTIEFKRDAPSIFNFSSIKKFTSLMPDPENLPGGFIAVVLIKNGGTTEYITLKGHSSCFDFGTCYNGPSRAYDAQTAIMAKNICKDYSPEQLETILSRINCGGENGGGWGGGGGSGGGGICGCIKNSDGELFLMDTMVNTLQRKIDDLFNANATCAKQCASPGIGCDKDYVTLRIYDQDYENKFGVPVASAGIDFYKADWLCFNNDSIAHLPNGDRFIAHVPDFVDLTVSILCRSITLNGVTKCVNRCRKTLYIDNTSIPGKCILKFDSRCMECVDNGGSGEDLVICSCDNTAWDGGDDDWDYNAGGDPPVTKTVACDCKKKSDDSPFSLDTMALGLNTKINTLIKVSGILEAQQDADVNCMGPIDYVTIRLYDQDYEDANTIPAPTSNMVYYKVDWNCFDKQLLIPDVVDLTIPVLGGGSPFANLCSAYVYVDRTSTPGLCVLKLFTSTPRCGSTPGTETNLIICVCNNIVTTSTQTQTCLGCKKSSDSSSFSLSALALILQHKMDSFAKSSDVWEAQCAAATGSIFGSIDFTLYDQDYEDAYGAPAIGPHNGGAFKIDWECFNQNASSPDYITLSIPINVKAAGPSTSDPCYNQCINTFYIDKISQPGTCILKLKTECGSFGSSDVDICSCTAPIIAEDEDEEEGEEESAYTGPCELPCPVQIELPPIPGVELGDIKGFVTIQPDPERIYPKGYFKAVAYTYNGKYINVRGFMECLPNMKCSPCESEELIDTGSFMQSMNRSAVRSSYNYTASLSSMAVGSYTMTGTTNGVSGFGNYSDNTTDNGSLFLVARSKTGAGITTLWKKTSVTVETNALYEFSFYYLNPQSSPVIVTGDTLSNSILLKVNGRDIIVRKVLYESSARWHKYTYSFNTYQSDKLDIELDAIETSLNNYVAIDDVSLKKVCGCTDLNVLANGDFNNDYSPNYASPIETDLTVTQYELTKKIITNNIDQLVIKDQLKPGTGQFMSFTIPNSVPTVVWKQTVNVQPGKEYAFNAWWLHRDVNTASFKSVEISLRVNGQIIQSINSGQNLDKWYIIQGRWTNNNLSSALVEVIFTNPDNMDDHYGALDEVKFTELCNPGICPLPILYEVSLRSCQTYVDSLIAYNAQKAYEFYIGEEKIKFQEHLINKCLNVYEDFEMKFIQSEQLFTLYYYDQSGNLVRTVPPAGISTLNNALGDLNTVKADRKAGQRNIFTDHTYASTYKYNSLGQVLEQSTPDQDNFNIADFANQYTSTISDIISTAFFRESDGIAVGSKSSPAYGMIATTVNNSANLADITSPLEYGDITSVIVVNNGTTVDMVYAVSKQKQLLYSDDKGAKWYTKRTPSANELVQVYYNGSRVFIFNISGQVWSSNDKGDTWQQEAGICANCTIAQVSYADANNAVALAENGRRFYIKQGQSIWSESNSIVLPDLNAITEVSVSNSTTTVLFAAGNNGTIIKSNDKGLNWEKVKTKTAENFARIEFLDEQNAIAVSSNGGLYKTADAGINWTSLPNSYLDYYTYAYNVEKWVDVDKNGDDVYLITDYGTVGRFYLSGSSIVFETKYYYNFSSITFNPVTSISVVDQDNIYFAGNNFLVKLEYNSSLGYLDLTQQTFSSATFIGSANVTDIHFSTTSLGVLITDDGKLYHANLTTTPGQFALTAQSQNAVFTGLYFMNDINTGAQTKGYAYTAAGATGFIDLSTSTAFNGWAFNTKTAIANSGIKAIWVENAMPAGRCVAIGTPGAIYASDSRAGIWIDKSSKVKLPDLKRIQYIKVSSDFTAIAAGDNGIFLKSTDKGSTWVVQNNNDADRTDIKDLVLATTSNAFAITSNPGKFMRMDDGINWGLGAATVIPSGFNTNRITLKEYGSSVKKAVISGANSSGHKLLYEIDLALSSPAAATQLTASGIPNIVGSYNSIAAYKNSTEFFVYAVGNKAVAPAADQDACTNTNLSLFVYSSTAANTKFVTTCKLEPLLDITILGKSNQAIAIGSGGLILKTKDKGVTWQRKDGKTRGALRSVVFYDELNGAAVGDNGALIVTTDGGETWKLITLGSSTLYDLVLLNGSFGAAVGNSMAIYMLNGGNFTNAGSWVDNKALAIAGTGLPASTSPWSAAFVDKRHGFIVSLLTNKGILYNASSPGNPWSATPTDITGLVLNKGKSVIMQDLKKGYIVTADNKTLKTTNGGISWEVLSSNSNTNPSLTSISSPDNVNFYIASSVISPGSATISKFKNIDHYGSKFYYDRLGRLVVSQNSKQFNKSASDSQYYSYTLYDYKGRITESGEVRLPSKLEGSTHTISGVATPVYGYGILDYNVFAAWVRSLTANRRTEVTHTYYDAKVAAFNQIPAGFKMENLRNRVAHATYMPVNLADSSLYEYATHYSYDIHGNVKSILHENNIIPSGIILDGTPTDALRFKRINYEFDLISGNVNKVEYQAKLDDNDPENPDRFFHKYEYDDENKLLRVLTSNDGIIWQQDAKYLYYMHGALARVELGHNQVQGIDYAYTIQGWLKGVNSTAVTATNRDIGKDGNLNYINRNFAPDQYGFTVGYYQNDYLPNGRGSIMGDANFYHQMSPGTSIYLNTYDLFNGNIGLLSTSIRQFGSTVQGMSYRYDQLNRLRNAQAYYSSNGGSWASSPSSNYKESFTYDANGNIKTLQRNDGGGANMDNFTYKYATAANGYAKNSNRLRAVQDAVSTPNITDDIENNQPYGGGANAAKDNYNYDELGNLIKDTAGLIKSIDWTLTGKIKRINFYTTSGKDNLEFFYDAAGNRIMKVVKTGGGSDPSLWTYTEYARDAQGNILSTYNVQEGQYKQESAVLYGSNRLGDFVPDKYEHCGITTASVDYNREENVRAWMNAYLKATVGLTDAQANSVITAWGTSLSTDLSTGYNFGVTMALQNGKNLLELWAKMFCEVRCFKQVTNMSLYTPMLNSYTSYVKTKFSSNLSVYDPQKWQEIQEYVLTTIIPAAKSNPLQLALYLADCGNTYTMGSRRFELTNHLGNVMTVVSDRKTAVGGGIYIDQSFFGNDVNVNGWTNRNGATSRVSIDTGLTVTVLNINDGIEKTFTLKAGQSYGGNFQFRRQTTTPLKVEVIDGNGSVRYSQIGTWTNDFNWGFGFSTLSTSNVVTIRVVTLSSTGTPTTLIVKSAYIATNVAQVSGYTADVQQATDYYAFGSPMPGRTYQKVMTPLPAEAAIIMNAHAQTWTATGNASTNNTTGNQVVTLTSTGNGAIGYTFNTPTGGTKITPTVRVKAGLMPLKVKVYNGSGTLLSTQDVSANVDQTLNLQLNSNATQHKVSVENISGLTYITDGANAGNWQSYYNIDDGTSPNYIYDGGGFTQVYTSYIGDGGRYYFATPSSGEIIRVNVNIESTDHPVSVGVYDLSTNLLVASTQTIPAYTNTVATFSFHSNQSNYELRTIVKPNYGETNAHETNSWQAFGGSTIKDYDPSAQGQRVLPYSPYDGASYFFNTLNTGENVLLDITVDPTCYDMEVAAFDEWGNQVTSTETITAYTPASLSFMFPCSWDISEIRIWNTNCNASYGDPFYITNLDIQSKVLLTNAEQDYNWQPFNSGYPQGYNFDANISANAQEISVNYSDDGTIYPLNTSADGLPITVNLDLDNNYGNVSAAIFDPYGTQVTPTQYSDYFETGSYTKNLSFVFDNVESYYEIRVWSSNAYNGYPSYFYVTKLNVIGGTNNEPSYFNIYQATVATNTDKFQVLDLDITKTVMVTSMFDDESKYRFGFNGMEKDNETYGDGNEYDFGARIYDARSGRWLSLDPLAKKFVDCSPYIGMGNSPTSIVDVDGRDIILFFYSQTTSGTGAGHVAVAIGQNDKSLSYFSHYPSHDNAPGGARTVGQLSLDQAINYDKDNGLQSAGPALVIRIKTDKDVDVDAKVAMVMMLQSEWGPFTKNCADGANAACAEANIPIVTEDVTFIASPAAVAENLIAKMKTDPNITVVSGDPKKFNKENKTSASASVISKSVGKAVDSVNGFFEGAKNYFKDAIDKTIKGVTNLQKAP
jgi:RHS repeat-associated protein